MVTNKSVTVEQLISLVNRLNRFSKDAPTVRQGWNSIAEEILLQTGNYRGFKLLGPDEVPDGQLPGICEQGCGDQTRKLFRLS